ncbi:MAG: diguanylate cyclase [Parcubacteria group bacterium]
MRNELARMQHPQPVAEVPPRKKEFLESADKKWLADLKIENNKKLRALAHVESAEGEKTHDDEEDALSEELKRQEFLGDKDGLTYLENQRGLFAKGIEMFEAVENMKAGERSISVISMDVDYFKAFNDISHTFGDVALQRIGQVLLEYKKQSGFSSRIGGEEIFLLVDKQIPFEEVKERAEELKGLVHQALLQLFAELDEQKRQPGATAKFLESRILKGGQNRHGFNEEYVQRDEFVSAKELARATGLVFKNEIEPAEFVLLLNEQIDNARDKDDAKRWQAIKDSLKFEVGTITVGGAHVEFASDSSINADDRVELTARLQKLSIDNQELTKVLSTGTYMEFYLALATVVDSDTAKDIINASRGKRFGKILDQADHIASEQKKLSRNSFVVEPLKMNSLDTQGVKEISSALMTAYYEEKRVLEKMLDDNVAEARAGGKYLVDDYYADGFARVEKRLRLASVKEWQNYRANLLDYQRQRYFHPMTLCKNYDYLTQVVPRELARCQEKQIDCAMVVFDMDNLKALNEAGGHKLGNVALMMVSRVMQEGLKDIKPELSEKIEATGIAPSIIRATQGEEFVLTLPGLNSREAAQVFKDLAGKTTAAIKKIVEQTGNKSRVEEYIAGMDLETVDRRRVKRSQAEIEKYGTMTAGIISLEDAGDKIIDNGKLNAGLMRELADEICTQMKDTVDEKGESGRGKIGLWKGVAR